MDHPLLLLLLIAAGFYLAKLWRDDLRLAQAGTPHPKALPGAAPAPVRALIIAMAGALVLLAVETAGEYRLGIADQQSRMTWLFAGYSVLAAPVVEELIFRGLLAVEKRGPAAMWGGAIGASAAFALCHEFLWQWDEAGFALTLDAKGWFSSAMVFALSLWLYVARFAPWNPQRSLLPCIAGHAAKNAGVVLIKAAAGFMGPAW
jgi:membrane protease YdiL (CAAX protease family)